MRHIHKPRRTQITEARISIISHIPCLCFEEFLQRRVFAFTRFYVTSCDSLSKDIRKFIIQILGFKFPITPIVFGFCYTKLFYFMNYFVKIVPICELHSKHLQLIKPQHSQFSHQSKHL